MKQSQQAERIADTIKNKETKFIDYEKFQFLPKSDFVCLFIPFLIRLKGKSAEKWVI